MEIPASSSSSSSSVHIYDRWLLCTIASLFCFFILIFFLNYNQHGLNLSTDISIGVLTTTTTSIDNGWYMVPNSSTDTTATITSNGEHVSPNTTATKTTSKDNATDTFTINNNVQKKCDIFDGRWIYNPKGRPLFEASQCPFLGPQVTCKKNGRPDFEYEKWRWEAKDCEIPRFNGTDMLERLRGKRLIIVGDSLNRNQFESLSCLLYSSIPSNSAYVNVQSDSYKVFRAKDYNCTVEFYWSPFLMELEDTNRVRGRLLKLDILSASAERWRGADIMVFNTGHWWVHTGKYQAWDYFQHKGKLITNIDVATAFQTAMEEWAAWIDRNVDPAKSSVFFRSTSPDHKGQQWCYNQTQPTEDEFDIPNFMRHIVETVERTITEMKTPVGYLNITKLSQYRKDAHPSVYTAKGQGKLLTEEQKKQPLLFADCSHWCIPGVPDTWNSLLYASLVLDTSRRVL
ncbi:hypothetical protein AQUCO_08100028v1 [Aquilegia coerulea]|uniref:Uncharacterized protein n=1 Tax=Aquilegia coerulea TaxID=218851 RepID=A0A2G5C7N6_AQUCA|nr:hypothetical protein AQUCO_08100028v1 [Aquilegia coerulea]